VPRTTPEEVTDFLERVFPGALDRFLIEEIGDGTARIRMLYQDWMLRPGGTVSGPQLMSLADVTMWVALLGDIGLEPLSVTSNLNIDFLRKPMPGDVVAEAQLLKVGRKLAVGRVTMFSDGEPRPVAHATVTYAIPSQRTTSP
jgi:uncharacterized protein (TIGR00369 family)